MKAILFVSVIVALVTLAEGDSQFWQSMSSFLQQDLTSFLFSKDPGLVRVRRLDQVKRGMSDAVVLDFVGLVEQYGYPAEEHNLVTEDGYNLVIHRIPGSPLSSNTEKKKVVFMQHGMLASSDTWVLFGSGKDLAFLLADRGYDVWIGNFRGNSYCRSHVNITTRDRKFWQFSFHDAGTKDLPAMIDYVLNRTEQKDLRYIGHSMGTTALFVLLSTRPEYNAKVQISICLSPVAFFTKMTKLIPMYQQILSLAPTVLTFLTNNEIYDVVPLSVASITLGRTLCNDQAITQPICIAIMFLFAGSDPAQINTTTLPHVLSYVPAGGSVQTLQHYYQNIVTGDFRQYDYGVVDNCKQYGQKTPPSYDVKRVTAPFALFYSNNDVYSTKQTVLKLSKYLPNVVLIEEIPFELFNHIDFLWAIDVKTLLYDRVLQVLQKFDAN